MSEVPYATSSWPLAPSTIRTAIRRLECIPYVGRHAPGRVLLLLRSTFVLGQVNSIVGPLSRREYLDRRRQACLGLNQTVRPSAGTPLRDPTSHPLSGRVPPPRMGRRWSKVQSAGRAREQYTGARICPSIFP